AFALAALLVACAAHSTAHTGVSRDELTAWETRLAAAPECRVRLTPAVVRPHDAASAGDASLVVRLVAFGSHELLDFAHLRVQPLDGASRVAERADSSGAMPTAFDFALPAGRYALVAQSFGFQSRTDTVVARAGTTD